MSNCWIRISFKRNAVAQKYTFFFPYLNPEQKIISSVINNSATYLYIIYMQMCRVYWFAAKRDSACYVVVDDCLEKKKLLSFTSQWIEIYDLIGVTIKVRMTHSLMSLCSWNKA